MQQPAAPPMAEAEAEAEAAAEERAIPAFWRALGLPGLLDVHVHFMPAQVMVKVWRHFDAIRAPDGAPAWPIRYRGSDAARLDRLRAWGVRGFPSLAYPHKPGMAEWLNGWAAGFADAHPACLRSATFYPEPAAARYVADALAMGARVFKAHVQVGGYDPRDPLLAPVWGMLADARVPVVAHVGSGPNPGRFTGPGVFAEVLRAHPRLLVVVAHLGMPEYAEFVALAERHQGVHLDTTMAFTSFAEALMPFPRALLPRLAALGLAGRVLLGSDFPNIPYPYAHQLESLARLDLGEAWLRAVCHDGAARLFGLDGGPDGGPDGRGPP